MKKYSDKYKMAIGTLSVLFWSAILMFFNASSVFADATGKIKAKLDNPLGSTTTLNGFIEKILEIFVKIGTPIIALAIVYVGFLFVKAQGNEAEITKAKNAFFWVIVGGLIVLGAKGLGTAISGTIGAL